MIGWQPNLNSVQLYAALRCIDFESAGAIAWPAYNFY